MLPPHPITVNNNSNTNVSITKSSSNLQRLVLRIPLLLYGISLELSLFNTLHHKRVVEEGIIMAGKRKFKHLKMAVEVAVVEVLCLLVRCLLHGTAKKTHQVVVKRKDSGLGLLVKI
jgi:hypothetical protein